MCDLESSFFSRSLTHTIVLLYLSGLSDIILFPAPRSNLNLNPIVT